MQNSPTSLIAAIVPQDTWDTDEVLAGFSRSLLAAGWRIRGLLQETEGNDKDCEIILRDLADKTRYPITQELGSCSSACRLDAGAMTEAGIVLRRIATEGADLAIINRFGKQEAAGAGFATEMLDLMSRGIPVLTVVQDKYLDAWRHFTGGLSIELPPERSALETWFSQLSAARLAGSTPGTA